MSAWDCRILFWFSALVVAPLTAPSAGAEIDYRLFARLAPSVLKIEAHNTNGSVSIGSGVMIAEGLVVTNCHVTRNATRIDVTKGGARWIVKSQTSDIDHDICMLSAPGAAQPAATVSSKTLRVGDTVIAIGYVGGLGPRMAGGQVTAMYELDGARVIQSTAAFSSGASGGGLFDENGNLVGVIAFKYRGGDGHHFSLPVKWIHDALGRAALEVAPLSGGLAFWQERGDRQPYFLQAAALEADGEWQKLIALAEKWTAVEKVSADAWFVLGQAYARARQDSQAVQAYREAVMLNSQFPEAWYALGATYARMREHGEVERVHQTLKGIDERFAAALFNNFLLQCAKSAAIATCESEGDGGV
jgi:serine protease Do